MRRLGYKAVWQIHNNMNRKRLFGLGIKLNHWLAQWGADAIWAVSGFIAGNWEGSGVSTYTIRNAAGAVFPSANQLGHEAPLRCLIAGRMTESKGHHLAVEAVIAARRAGMNVCLDVFGGPTEHNPYADQLRRMIAAAGEQDAIEFKGFSKDLRRMHQSYHLGLQCRIDPEPCSFWVCETLVDGLPLVASASGGTPELVEDGVTGLLFRPGDVKDLTEKLIQLARDPQRISAMRVATFKRGQRDFSVARFVKQVREAWAALGD
jgi:hypothetical protein